MAGRTTLSLWERVQDQNEKGFGLTLFRILLSFLSFLYGIGVWLRNSFYDIGLLRSVSLPCFVVSVGNLAVGGTGKTPVVIHLAKRLAAKGKRVAVLTRGYARKGNESIRAVKPDDSAQEVGDEPLLLARRLVPIPVVVGKDRARNGAWVADHLKVDALILDDGFQYRRLKKDAEIVLLDATSPLGNGRLLPRGILRESPSSLRRADLVLLSKVEQCEIINDKITGLEERLQVLNPGMGIAKAAYIPLRLIRLGTDETLGEGELAGKSVLAFSGIASPASFRKTLEGLGARMVGERAFPDHHYYTETEIQNLVREAQEKNAWGLVTTEKDGVRIPRVDSAIPIWMLSIDIEIRSGNDALNTLLRL